MDKRTIHTLAIFTVLVLASGTASAFSLSGLFDWISSLFGGSSDEGTTTTTQPKVVCNPPYIKTGNTCCLDKNSNRICDKDEETTTTKAPTTTLKTETTQPKKDTHMECLKGYCKEVAGKGEDKCARDKECRHNECASQKCVEVMEPGASACQIDSQCESKATHKACMDGVCKDVKGEGQDECVSNSQCKHKECVHTQGMPSKCETVLSPGEDTCTDDFSCFEVAVGHCMSGQCRFDVDSGPNCTKSSECYHNVCENDQCVMKLSPGTNECDTDLNCVEWEYHYECQNGACVKIEGSGTNECLMDAQCPSTPTTTQAGATTTTQAGATTTTVRVTTTVVIVSCQGTGVYNTNNCDNNCDASCEKCEQITGLPCYRCVKDCGKLGAGWGTSSVCGGCDTQHEECVEHDSCDGCYHCVEVCPEDTNGVDYYRFQGCDAKCQVELCRQVKLHEPQSKYKDCYRCYEPECGDGILSLGEECEVGATQTCQDTHSGSGAKYLVCDPFDCLCYPDCDDFCDDQGNFPDVNVNLGGGATQADCDAEMKKQMNALKGNCKAVCGEYAWYPEKNGEYCCCIDVDSRDCLNCPNQNPALIDCNTPLAQCKAGL
ncbi:MAG: hypothetical protein ABIH11_08300 [Candidatus Altiarchaeota archaeon]